MTFENKYLRWAGFLFMGIAFLVSLNIAVRRFGFEIQNQQVDVAGSYSELRELSYLGGISETDLLSRIANKRLLSSIMLEEDTLQTFIDNGKVTLLKGSEILNMLRVGKVYHTVLSNLAQKTKIKPDRLYLVVDEYTLYERLKSHLLVTLETGSVVERGWNILELRTNEMDLMELGFGLDINLAKRIHGLGFSIIGRLRNPRYQTEAAIKLKLSNIEKKTLIHTVIFEGTQVMGYPSMLPLTAEHLRAKQLNFGLIEFAKQKGAYTLAKSMPESVLKVHSISEDELPLYTPSRALTRYVRAAKERGCQILVVHPFLDYVGSRHIVDVHLSLLEKLNIQLRAFRFNLGPFQSLSRSQYIPAYSWEIALLSLGLFMWIILFISRFSPFTPKTLSMIFLSFILSMGVFLGLDYVGTWSRVMSLLSAIFFPIFSLIVLFPSVPIHHAPKKKLLSSVLFLCKLLGLCLIGALFIIGFTSDLSFLIGIRQFFGVKLSFLVPLIVIGLFYYLRPQRLKSIYYVLKRLFFAPISMGALLSSILFLGFVVIYILRSGNYVTIAFIETWMRNSLESLLFVRPRTKEFLIGYPFLLIAYYYVDSHISRNWIWFFNTIGAVALISVINSFCHTHTPIFISLYRCLIGLFLGIFMGWLYISLFTLAKSLFKRLSA